MLAIFVVKCSVTIFDWRYRLWEVGVVMTNRVSAVANLATGDFKVLFLFVCNLATSTLAIMVLLASYSVSCTTLATAS